MRNASTGTLTLPYCNPASYSEGRAAIDWLGWYYIIIDFFKIYIRSKQGFINSRSTPAQVTSKAACMQIRPNRHTKRPAWFMQLRAFMHRNTLKTSWGFLLTLLRNRVSLPLRTRSIQSIYNFLPIDEHWVTSGQPSAQQFELIQQAGFNTVINLAPHNAENALPDERSTLAALGVHYVHIPVDFKQPTEQNFEAFVAAVEAAGDTNLWIHCAANMRVSAFMYRYRTTVRGEDPALAATDLGKIWTPVGVWRRFIAVDQPGAPSQ